MKFFFPYADTDEEAEREYQATRSRIEAEYGTPSTERRIHSLTYFNGNDDETVTVEAPDPSSYEVVFVILESVSKDFLVCRYEKGILSGRPLTVYRHSVKKVVDFD